MQNQECLTTECSNDSPCEWCEYTYERAFGPAWYDDWYDDLASCSYEEEETP
jgi:hypothetical protein